jgi:hypothetical protein
MRRLPAGLPVSVTLLLLGLVACGSGSKPPPAPSIAVLAADPILLSRVLERCNANPAAVTTPECTNARAAADRRMADDQAAKARKAESGFEYARDLRRQRDEAAARVKAAEEQRKASIDLAVEGAEPPPASP